MAMIDAVKRFAGVDSTADTTVLQMCLDAAIKWYEDAGVHARPNDANYDFWIANLAAWMFDNRGADGASTVIPPYIVSSVHQLRGTNPGGGA